MSLPEKLRFQSSCIHAVRAPPLPSMNILTPPENSTPSPSDAGGRGYAAIRAMSSMWPSAARGPDQSANMRTVSFPSAKKLVVEIPLLRIDARILGPGHPFLVELCDETHEPLAHLVDACTAEQVA